jgi:N6-adenosine-specific RNA methylase IME4
MFWGRVMSGAVPKDRFTKIAGDLLLGVRDLVDWGINTGNLTHKELEHEVIRRDPKLRAIAARKMIDAGLSQRQAAKLLGVNHKTIQNDVANKSPKSGEQSATHGKAKIAKWEGIAAAAGADGVTPDPTEKYRIVYADPPWLYSNTQPDYFGEQRDHYPVMPLEEICAIPVKDWVEDDAVLFLWATSPILEDAFKVVRAWGFEYKASFVWDKIKHVMGHYNSVRHELLLICTRGSCQPDDRQLFDSVQNIERGKHSAKPVEFYDIIETNYTHGRRLTMFARGEREGWDVYGHVSEITDAAAE